MNRSTTHSRLRVELLEDRQLLAGDVDVFAIGNVLHVRGDGLDNGLAITSTSEGVLEVSGLNQGGAVTTINGLASQPFIRIKEIIISLGEGNDALVATRMPLSGSMSIQMGQGNDFVGLGEFDNNSLVDSAVNSLLDALVISTNLAIDTGEGNDIVAGRNVSTKALVLTTLGGDDVITLDHQGNPGDPNHVPGITASAGLAINAGEGTNIVTLSGLNIMSLTVTGGAVQDTVTVEKATIAKGANIQAKDGANLVTLEEVTSKSLHVSAGLGNDTVTLEQVTCSKRISLSDNYGNDLFDLEDVAARSLGISAGFGADTISLEDVTTTQSIRIDSGDGEDEVTLKDIIAKSLATALGDGADELSLDNVAATKKVIIGGGIGNDTPELKRVSAAALEILLAAGDDEISLETVLVSGKTRIDGGQDTNVYTDMGGNSLPILERTNFQTIV